MAFDIKKFLFPIERNEWQKFLPMAFIMFFIIFVLSILRTTKETLVISSAGSGVEIISFIKTYCVLPASFLYMIFYVVLSNFLSQRTLFYITLFPFLLFFLCYGLFIYPNLEYWHLSAQKISYFQQTYPSLKWFVLLFGNWGFTLFFVVAELWSGVVLSLMFWQFANDITTSEQAKRFYGLFGIIGNFGLIFGGMTVMSCSQCTVGLDKVASWGNSVKLLSLAASLAVMAILLLYYWMTSIKGFKRKPSLSKESSLQKVIQPKITLREQITYVAKSKHLQFLILIVISYFITLNFCEAIFKDRVLKVYNESHEYNTFMGRLQMLVGILSVLLTFVGSTFLRFFTWRTGALITPCVMLISSAIFFGFILVADHPFLSFNYQLPLMVVWIGLGQSIVIRATKYSLFDPTREMIYIPLDSNLRTKGKACVDLLGGRLGKGGGAWIQSLIFIFTGLSFQELTLPLLIIIWCVIIVWIIAIQRLSHIHKPSTSLSAES